MSDPFENTTQRKFEELDDLFQTAKADVINDFKSHGKSWVVAYLLFALAWYVIWVTL